MSALYRMMSFALLASGLIHLWIAPEHYAHAPAHGLFFGIVGALQAGYALYNLLRSPAPHTMGLLLSGGVAWMWVLTHWFAVPFATEVHEVEWSTLSTKALELSAFGILIYLDQRGFYGRAGKNPAEMAVISGCICVLGSSLIWAGALFATPMLPQLAEVPGAPGHNHSDGTHSHSDATAGTVQFTAGASSTANTYNWNLPEHFPEPYVPADNPMTDEKVFLGRHLFYDQRISVNSQMSCASCHTQAIAFTDAKTTSVGTTGEVLERNSQSLTNVAYYSTLTWANPVLTDLEQQLRVPLFGELPIELGVTGHEEEILARFKADAQYEAMFREAFPEVAEPITWQNLIYALASFNRALISANSAYDQYLLGKIDALSPSALRGMDLFLSEELECHHCHGGFNFSGSTRQSNTVFVEAPFHNTGLYNIDGQGMYPEFDIGVADVSNKPEDVGRFRAPSLRNVALTAPYFHDGSAQTLDEVLRIYEAGGRTIESGPYAGDGRRSPLKSSFVSGFVLTDQERNDLIAFLEALTDEEFITNPAFSDPFTKPAANAQP